MLEPIQPCVAELSVVLVDESMLVETELWLSGCEHCSETASHTLDYLLDELTGCDPTITEYALCRPARCPSCLGEITEKTRVRL